MDTELMQPPQALQEQPDPGALIRRHQRMIWRYLRLLGAAPNEADDLMQDTFLKMLVRRPVDHGPEALAGYLRQVARHVFLDARRSAGRRAALEVWTSAVDDFVAREPRAFDDERVDALRVCLHGMKGRGRTALELRHAEGLDTEAAATLLGLTINGFKSLLQRARRVLRQCVLQRLAQTDTEDQR